MKNQYIPGNHWVICDRCGMKRRRSKCRFDGDNPALLVCTECYDPEHPHITNPPKGLGETQRVDDPRPPADPPDYI